MSSGYCGLANNSERKGITIVQCDPPTENGRTCGMCGKNLNEPNLDVADTLKSAISSFERGLFTNSDFLEVVAIATAPLKKRPHPCPFPPAKDRWSANTYRPAKDWLGRAGEN